MKPNKHFGILALLGVLLWGCSNNGTDEKARIIIVKTEPAALADTLEIRTFSGVISEASEVNLAFRVAGPIARLMVREGDKVRAGQVVAIMDTRDYEIQLQAARAQYRQVKAEADRIIELYNRNSISANDYDKAVSGLSMVEAQLRRAQDQLNDTRLVSPASGYIQKINFRQSEMVDAGMPVATLIDVTQYHVNVDLPVSVFTKLDDVISFTAKQPLLGEDVLPLRMLGISKRANQNQLFRLQLALDPEVRHRLSPGMDVLVTLTLRSNRQPNASIPLSALFYRDNQTFVWIFDPATNLVNSRQVTSGKLLDGGRISIESGLQPGEQVVVAGVSLMSEGQKAEPLKEVTETNVGGLL